MRFKTSSTGRGFAASCTGPGPGYPQQQHQRSALPQPGYAGGQAPRQAPLQPAAPFATQGPQQAAAQQQALPQGAQAGGPAQAPLQAVWQGRVLLVRNRSALHCQPCRVVFEAMTLGMQSPLDRFMLRAGSGAGKEHS